MAALEVLRTLKETGIQLPFHLEAVDFTDEEGTLVGMLGSQALTGKFHAGVLERNHCRESCHLAALEKGGLHVERISEAARSPRSLCGYLELHIEQAPGWMQRVCKSVWSPALWGCALCADLYRTGKPCGHHIHERPPGCRVGAPARCTWLRISV